MSKSLEDSIRNERLTFLKEIGLDESLFSHFGFSPTMSKIDTMKDSFTFFSDLGSNIKKIYKDYPQLLTYLRETNLEPKLQFLIGEIGVSKRIVARLPELFTYPLNSMQNIYKHYVNKFEGNEKQAKALLRDATSVLGNDTNSIDNKIKRYEKVGIDFHRNYVLLEINPEKVINTRNYLTILQVSEPETGKWYHMLLATSRKILEPKVNYCEKECIDWEAKPKVLVLGLGTEEKPGALPRRVNMIKDAFSEKLIPSKLDYKSNPLILELPDKILKERIKLHR